MPKPKPNASASAKEVTELYFKVVSEKVLIRDRPATDAEGSLLLSATDVFVVAERLQQPENTYLRLADGSGWVPGDVYHDDKRAADRLLPRCLSQHFGHVEQAELRPYQWWVHGWRITATLLCASPSSSLSGGIS